MILNTHDISYWNGTFLGCRDADIEITTYEDWLDNAVAPKIYRTIPKYNTIELRVIIEGTTLAEKNDNISDLIAELIEAELNVFNEVGYYFTGNYDSHSEEYINKKASELKIMLKGYKHLPQTQTTTTSGSQFVVGGNADCSCKITFDAIGTGECALYIGNANSSIIRDYKFKVESGGKYTIDGLSGVFKKGNDVKMSDYLAYSFPALFAGRNSITFTSSLISNVKFEYKGRLI